MIARPILFTAPMIRALLAGRKTQTRRIVKVQPPAEAVCAGVIHSEQPSDGLWSWLDSDSLLDASIVGDDFRCPYGVPGDALWARETWAQNANQVSDDRMDTSIVYRADGEQRALDNGTELPWRPSIFMPRCASRLTLTIDAIRVERLQDISEADAIAEGLIEWSDPPRITAKHYGLTIADVWETKASAAYARLWETINGKGSWAANPWVWALTFSIERRNVDDVIREAA